LITGATAPPPPPPPPLPPLPLPPPGPLCATAETPMERTVNNPRRGRDRSRFVACPSDGTKRIRALLQYEGEGQEGMAEVACACRAIEAPRYCLSSPCHPRPLTQRTPWRIPGRGIVAPLPMPWSARQYAQSRPLYGGPG